jgi:pyrroline-5-carboxylate reductase
MEDIMKKIGFIGAGHMGFPLILGGIKAFGIENVTFAEKSEEVCASVEKKTGLKHSESNAKLITDCDYIVLCVKPQFFKSVAADLKENLNVDKVIISIMAGVSIDDIKEATFPYQKVIRVMPNTPAQVGAGMSCISYNKKEVSEDCVAVARKLLTTVGDVEEIDEKLMAAATCANGSSPAYVYIFMEALADSLVKYDIPRALSYKLVGQTVLGSAKMLLETGEHPGELKDAVCSPSGTTIAGVSALEEYGFRNAIIKATDACYEKATHLK